MTALGRGIAEAGLHLVYGGGYVGLMGTVADAAVAAGGRVTGVIPEFLAEREVMHTGLTELVVTTSMHSRKQRMFSEADAFLICPGGYGTFDEMMEIITWKQLGRHSRPIVIVNIENWAEAVLKMLDVAIEQGFASEESRSLFTVVPDVNAALALLKTATKQPMKDAETIARL